MKLIPDAAPDDEQELEIIAACRRGDRVAFRSLYERHYRRVHRTALCLGTPTAELEDVTQEVFTAAFSKLDRFQGGHFGHWLHRVCANVVTDHHRRRRVRDTVRKLFRISEEEEIAGGPGPEAAAQRSQAQAQVAQI